MSFMKNTLFLALFAASCTASAGSTSFSPLGFTLRQNQSIDSMTLTNTGDSAVRFQARAFSWSQVDGKDVLTPTDDVKFGPPIFTMMPASKQKMRVIRAVQKDGPESQYKIVVTQIPVPPLVVKPEASNRDGADQASPRTGQDTTEPVPKPTQASMQVNMAMQFDLPLFYRADGAVPSLTGSWTPDGLRITNTGTATARLWDARAGGQMVKAGLMGYVLPGSSVVFPEVQGTGDLTVTMNGEDQVIAIR